MGSQSAGQAQGGLEGGRRASARSVFQYASVVRCDVRWLYGGAGGFGPLRLGSHGSRRTLLDSFKTALASASRSFAGMEPKKSSSSISLIQRYIWLSPPGTSERRKSPRRRSKRP